MARKRGRITVQSQPTGAARTMRRLMGVVHAHKTNKEQLGLMMTGALDLTDKDGKTAGIAKDSQIDGEVQD